MKDVNTVIIGGGISGLTCASILAERCIECVVLEQASKVGGNIYTYNSVDMGSWIVYNNFRFFRWLWKRSGYPEKLSVFKGYVRPPTYSTTSLSMISMCMENSIPVLSPYFNGHITDNRVSDYMDYHCDMNMAAKSIGASSPNDLHVDLFAPLYFRSRKKLIAPRGMQPFLDHLVSKYNIVVMKTCMVLFVCEADDGCYVVTYVHGKTHEQVRCRNIVFATNPYKFRVDKCSQEPSGTKCDDNNTPQEAITYTSILSLLIECDAIKMYNTVHLLDRDFIIQEEIGDNVVTAVCTSQSVTTTQSQIVIHISGKVDSDRMNELVARIVLYTNGDKFQTSCLTLDKEIQFNARYSHRIIKYITFSEAFPLVTDVKLFNLIRMDRRVSRYYCGQYLGPPTLETAVYTGIRAGFKINAPVPQIHKYFYMRHIYVMSTFCPYFAFCIFIIVVILVIVYGIIR